jgi:predicted phosphodiesterase
MFETIQITYTILTHYMCVRVVVMSDTHNHANNLIVPPGDILIHCGDFTDNGKKEERSGRERKEGRKEK